MLFRNVAALSLKKYSSSKCMLISCHGYWSRLQVCWAAVSKCYYYSNR